LGPDQASGSRYTYAVIGLLLPLSAIALSRIAAIGTAGVAVVLAFIVLVGSYNAGRLIEQANIQAAREQASHRLASATLAQWLADPRDDVLGLRPDPVVMPPLTIGGIVELHDKGWLDPGEYGPAESLTAETYLGVDVEPGSVEINSCETVAGDATIVPGQPVMITEPTAGTALLTLANEAATGTSRSVPLTPQPTVIRYDGSNSLTVRGDGAALTLCREA
jgi:hypothetical protein